MKTTQLDGFNYRHIDTPERLAHITKKHNAVRPSRKAKRLRNTGLTNVRPGDELIKEQAAHYAAQVRTDGIKKPLVFFDTGARAAKFEHAVLSYLVGATAYRSYHAPALAELRELAMQAGYTFNYIDTGEYTL